jgi:hypothetical protein
MAAVTRTRGKTEMPRKSKTEVLPPTRHAAVPDMRAILDKLVEKKVVEIMSKDRDALFRPYFQSKRVADEIRKNQTVSERKKWGQYFKKWGCDVCGTKESSHVGLGRCSACYLRTERRLKKIMAESAGTKAAVPVFGDRLGDAAREALRPAAALPPEKRMDLETIARKALRPIWKALPRGNKRRTSAMLTE